MANIPRDLGGCVDGTLCDYHGYFPNLKCVIRKCKNCGSSKFLQQILESNADKLSDNRKRFLIKQWVTKTERKEGATQSFLHWTFEKCTYEELAHWQSKFYGYTIIQCFLAVLPIQRSQEKYQAW